MSDQVVIRYQEVAWMRLHKAQDGSEYYELGPVEDQPHTLAVTPVDGNGATRFFCTRHNVAYHFMEACHECQTRVLEPAAETM